MTTRNRRAGLGLACLVAAAGAVFTALSVHAAPARYQTQQVHVQQQAIMDGLLAGGIDVTALHNHLNQVTPHVIYLHYEGRGDAVQLATALHQALATSGTAAITGDFVLIASEVNPLVRTLRQYGIEVTAIHSHALTDQPRLFYMHFFANDDALMLAQGLRVALDQTNSMGVAGTK